MAWPLPARRGQAGIDDLRPISVTHLNGGIKRISARFSILGLDRAPNNPGNLQSMARTGIRSSIRLRLNSLTIIGRNEAFPNLAAVSPFHSRFPQTELPSLIA